MKKSLILIIPLVALVACTNAKKEVQNETKEASELQVEETISEIEENQEEQEVLSDSVANKIEAFTKSKSAIPEVVEEEEELFDPNEIEIVEVEEEVVERSSPEHSIWNSFLKLYVSNTGKVNYAGIKADQSGLNAYLKSLEKYPVKSSWSKNEKLAYWMNAYNAYTIKLIVDNYPLKSITDIGEPWDKKFIQLDGKKLSLNDIENGILRKMGEPRIHFGINCASISCPKLGNTAFTSTNVNSLLNTLTKGFVNDKSKNNISENKIVISKVFDWFKADFTASGTVIEYLNKYSTTKISTGATIEYQEYNWDLNK